jgi:hypothetical protein
MASAYLNNLAISVEKQGAYPLARANPVLRQGLYSEIRSADYQFLFNRNGEIKFIRGLHTGWPHPAELLKRTDGNDWVYYSVGDDSSSNGVISWLGEYYLPCLPYPANSIWEIDYATNPAIMNAFAAWSQTYGTLYGAPRERLHPKIRAFVEQVMERHEGVLHDRAQQLNAIIGGRVSVLPPDTRRLDYNVIPLMIADGCLYHCRFCCVQSAGKFKTRANEEIREQIARLKAYYGPDLENYFGLFLGNHDALRAGIEPIAFAAEEAYRAFGFGAAGRTAPSLFLFGSVDALLEADEGLFQRLAGLPYRTSINVGLESCDEPTLAGIGKPLSPSKVNQAFAKLLEVNAACDNIEISANFVIGKGLSDEHYRALTELLRSAPAGGRDKGAIYLSPLKESPKKRELLPRIKEIQQHSRLPVYVYLIQRL